MSAPFLFSLRFSPGLRCASGFVHVLPVLCVWAPEVPFWSRAAVLIPVLVSALWWWRRAGSLAETAFSFQPGGECWIERGGRQRSVQLMATSRDFGFLIVLAWQDLESGRVERAALSRDGLPAETWRALRRYLRWDLPQQCRARVSGPDSSA